MQKEGTKKQPIPSLTEWREYNTDNLVFDKILSRLRSINEGS